MELSLLWVNILSKYNMYGFGILGVGGRELLSILRNGTGFYIDVLWFHIYENDIMFDNYLKE